MEIDLVTGQLGTPDSELGNIALGSLPAQQAGGGGTQAVSGFDFGVGVDSASFVGPLSGTTIEQPVGSDLGFIDVSSSDTAVGVESIPGIPVSALPFDPAIGTEGFNITATLPTLPEVGSMLDSITIGLTMVDTGLGVDDASFVDTTPPCDATSGTLEAPLTRLGPEYFLPHWTSANSNRTGLLFSLCQWGAENELQFKQEVQRAATSKYLAFSQTREPLYEWVVNFLPPSNVELTITFSANSPSGFISGSIRRAISRFDFETAVDPVWYQDINDRVIRFRSLFMRTIQRYSSGSVYTICGGDAAGYLGVVPDTGYFYRKSPANIWEWIPPENSRFSPQSVVLPMSGTWQIAYGSNADLASILSNGSVIISWMGGQSRSLPLTFTPISNLFDGYGLILGIPRLKDPTESNVSYKSRMLSLTLAPPDATIEGVIRGVSIFINSVNRTVWDGVSTLNIDPLGTQNITTVRVVGVERVYEVQERLYPTSGNTSYYSTFSNWRQGSIVFVDGIPTNSYSLSGNRITFSQSTTGVVEVVYSVNSYSTVTNSDGYITGLNPGTGIVSGTYDIIYTRAVNAHTVDLPDYQRDNLLLPNGLPNSLFTEIATKLTENNPTTFGRARWSTNAVWLEQTDQQPATSRLPIPTDVGIN